MRSWELSVPPQRKRDPEEYRLLSLQANATSPSAVEEVESATRKRRLTAKVNVYGRKAWMRSNVVTSAEKRSERWVTV